MAGDGMFHLSPAANAIWIRELRRFAAEQYALTGAYPPEPSEELPMQRRRLECARAA